MSVCRVLDLSLFPSLFGPSTIAGCRFCRATPALVTTLSFRRLLALAATGASFPPEPASECPDPECHDVDDDSDGDGTSVPPGHFARPGTMETPPDEFASHPWLSWLAFAWAQETN